MIGNNQGYFAGWLSCQFAYFRGRIDIVIWILEE